MVGEQKPSSTFEHAGMTRANFVLFTSEQEAPTTFQKGLSILVQIGASG